ncbi:thioesterase [Micromonospora qiuiae]|uniref:Thioesterase n=1 Tax=Micromonospora qiuiae TaxID=502268 RepID=A0ABQ4J9B9_9ACTN|nr:alpha/beta fold hydrolase [Micromonospora qiuiae]GIJ26727.1 thioesterase [Micromonospora qiuiae]
MKTDAGTHEDWVRRFHSAVPDATRLVCFPHAGGSASFYTPFSAKVSPALEVFAIQYPGRQDRRLERRMEDIRELADNIFWAMRTMTDRPLAFFGHSMGAILAYEVARRLERDGTVLRHLFASGRRAPSIQRLERVHEHDEGGVIAELRLLNGTDSSILSDAEMLEMIMPAIKSDYRAIESYRHQPGQELTCPITALVGDADPRVSIADAKAWGDHTGADFNLRVLPGGHFYLVDQAPAVIKLVQDVLVKTAP